MTGGFSVGAYLAAERPVPETEASLKRHPLPAPTLALSKPDLVFQDVLLK